MRIESRHLVKEDDEVYGRIGIEYDSEIPDIATLSFQRGKWETGFIEIREKSEDYVFAQLGLNEVEDLIQALKVIKLTMESDDE